MDFILQGLANQVAPLVLQLVGMILLAIASIVLLKIRSVADEHLAIQQQRLLGRLAAVAVHFAEKEGAGQIGAEKAKIAQDYLSRQLGLYGLTTITGATVVDTIIGAVQMAWANEIGPTDLSDATAAPAAPSIPAATSPQGA